MYREPNCKPLGFISGSGRDKFEALREAKLKAAKYGGNVIVEGKDELLGGSRRSTKKARLHDAVYCGIVYYCAPDNK